MLKHQIKWKLGALLLTAPLLAAPLFAPAVAHAETAMNITPAQTVEVLKKWVRFTNADGDRYMFFPDGTFAYYRGKESARGETYESDHGRFTVKERTYEPGDFDSSVDMLHLRIYASYRKSDGKMVMRTENSTVGIIVMASSKNDRGKSKPYILLGGSEGMRFR